MIRRLVLALLTLLVILAAGLLTALFIFRQPTPTEFEQATANRPVNLPRDEAAHLNVTTEWWYYTGFLTGADGKRYGFELVFFKAYAPPPAKMASVLPINWISNPVYVAHFAVSDLAARDHVFFEQSNFPQFWSASAKDDRHAVRNGEWGTWGSGGKQYLQATAGSYSLWLNLDSAKPAALHGPGGAGVVEMGQAGTSYYYSYTDLRGAGLLTVDGVQQTVNATAWMDHQWGSWDNHEGFAGWDWFSLRLDDGSQAMLFNFRDEDGQVLPQSTGTWIDPDGTTHHLQAGDFRVQVLEQWTSAETGATYPIKWNVAVPDFGLQATVEATFPEQEMAVQFTPLYWEGSVSVTGTTNGSGFVEMTGYGPGFTHSSR
jgi:predicted secreted hydrolase